MMRLDSLVSSPVNKIAKTKGVAGPRAREPGRKLKVRFTMKQGQGCALIGEFWKLPISGFKTTNGLIGWVLEPLLIGC